MPSLPALRLCCSMAACVREEGAEVAATDVEEYDTIVVGGGAAGCPLAARLSERSSNRVLLIEAGTDYPPGQEPPEILDIFAATAYADPRFVWGGPEGRVRAAARQRARRAAPRALSGGPGDRRRLLRSTAWRPIAACRPTMTAGPRPAPPAGTGRACCRSSRSSKPTATSTGRCTARTVRSACSVTRPSAGRASRAA